MFNILFVSNDIYYYKKLINFLVNSNLQEIRLINFVSNEQDSLDIINSVDLDIILLDINLTNLSSLLSRISDVQRKKLKFSIIVISDAKTNIHINNSMIYTYIDKDTNFDNIIKSINNLIIQKGLSHYSHEIIIREKIRVELKYIGYNLSYNGSRYLEETIFELYKNKESYVDNLSKDIYPIIAKKYDKSVNTIKCNIIRATDIMYCECNIERLKSYFKFYADSKPKPKLVAFTILNKLDLYDS